MKLSRTEFVVAAYVADGYEKKEIAQKLYRSYDTIAAHIRNIRKRNNLRNMADLAGKFALEYGNPKDFIVPKQKQEC